MTSLEHEFEFTDAQNAQLSKLANLTTMLSFCTLMYGLSLLCEGALGLYRCKSDTGAVTYIQVFQTLKNPIVQLLFSRALWVCGICRLFHAMPKIQRP